MAAIRSGPVSSYCVAYSFSVICTADHKTRFISRFCLAARLIVDFIALCDCSITCLNQQSLRLACKRLLRSQCQCPDRRPYPLAQYVRVLFLVFVLFFVNSLSTLVKTAESFGLRVWIISAHVCWVWFRMLLFTVRCVCCVQDLAKFDALGSSDPFVVASLVCLHVCVRVCCCIIHSIYCVRACVCLCVGG